MIVRMLIILGIYVALFSLVRVADRLLLFPSTEPIRVHDAARRQVPFGDDHLEIWTARSPEAADRAPQAYVLRFIGNADRAEHWAGEDARARHGMAVEAWAVNYPGFGGSGGTAKLATLGAAGLAAYDAMRAEAGDRPIFVHGMSLGCTVALHVAAHMPVAGLVLQNPPPLRQIILGRFGWWNLWLLAGPIALQVPPDLDAIANARRVHAPAVFVMSGADEIVPPSFQQRVVDAYAGEHRDIRLPGASHNQPLDPDATRQLAEYWTWMADRNVSCAPSPSPAGRAGRRS